MFSIQGFLACQSKFPMIYKHLSQVETHQIYALMKARHVQTQIAKLLDRHKSTISRELYRNRGIKIFRLKEACEMTAKRSAKNSNAATVPARMREQTAYLLCLQLSPKQIAGKLPDFHNTLYQHVYASKAKGSKLWKNLRRQNRKRKFCASGLDIKGQILHGCLLSDWPSHIEARKQVGHWECDTFISADRQEAIVSMIEHHADSAFAHLG
jgi:IS30 family transposase